MRARSGLIPSSFLVVLLPLILVSCSGGGSDTPMPAPTNTPASHDPGTPPPPPPAQPDMLTATPAGLLRGKASGQGQHLIFAHPNLRQETIMVSDPNVVYSRSQSGLEEDIWSVRTDGTGDHALANTPDREIIRAVSGPWMAFTKLTNDQEQHWSFQLNTSAQAFLENDPGLGTVIQFQGDRITLGSDYEVASILPTGAGRLTYDTVFLPETQFDHFIGVQSKLTYRKVNNETQAGDLFAVPLGGGAIQHVDGGQAWMFPMGSIGDRLVYHRCNLPFSPCDVWGAKLDSSSLVVLSNHPENEAVQGFTTDQVIIRRNLSGNDQLIAVPVAGGAEIPLMSMTDNEFVDLIVGDIIIVRRPSGTWRLDLNGTLTKLGTIVGDSGFIAVGDAVCVTKVTAVWCIPLDGSGPQVQIAPDGKVVGVL